MIKIAICDDHRLFTQTLKEAISRVDGLSITGAALTAKQLFKILEDTDTDIVLMDNQMPEMDGIYATSYILKKHPSVKVIGISMHDDTLMVKRMIFAGAKGYLIKNADIDEVITAIQKVHIGQTYLPGLTMRQVMNTRKVEPTDIRKILTGREMTILQMIAAEK